MIKPNKYTNLELSTINISMEIIKNLKENNIIPLGELVNALIKKYGDDVKEVFPSSISFLFLLDKITYHNQLDAFELKI